MNVASKVPAAFHGLNVIDYLATRFSYLSATTWRELLDQQRISCNGTVCGPSLIVAQGDRVRCDLPKFDPPTVNLDYRIVYEDDWLLAIDKPAGLRVHSGGKFVNANLIYHLRHLHQPPYPEATPVHRLDADTSGLVLLSRDKTLLSQLVQQFAEGLVDKTYLAVVEGCPSPASGSIDLPIGPVKGARIPRFAANQKEGKPALTHYRTIRQLSKRYSLLELRPVSGRTHQLRVHLAAIGHPLAGDALYTMNDADYLAWRCNPPQQASSLRRQALHHQHLEFFHPGQQRRCTLSAPLASDIEQFIQDVTATDQGSEIAP